MNAEDIIKIIDVIPKYISYIYPGYLTIYIYCFLRAKTIKDNKIVLVKSVMISYIYIIIIDALHIDCLLNRTIILIIISVVVSYICYRLTRFQRLLNLFNRLKIYTTFYDNEIETLANFNKGAWLCVYLKDDEVVYEGALGPKELEEGKTGYICLSGFYKYYLDNNGKPIAPYIEDHANNNDQIVMIFYDSIKRIEKRN